MPPLPLPPGQTAITTPPVWGGRGGGAEASRVYAWQHFNEIFGRDPSEIELDMLAPNYIGTDPNVANVSAGRQGIAAYFNQQQQIANAPKQEAEAIKQQIPIISDLIKQQTGAVSQDLLNPQSPTYQSFSGLMNQLGITPSSGAFQSGLGSRIGQTAGGFIGNALGDVGLPLAQTYSLGQTVPFQSAVNLPNVLQERQFNMQDWGMQADLAKQLADIAQPGWAEKYAIPLSQSLLQGAGNYFRRGGGGGGGKSAVCMELFKRGLITRKELHSVLSKLLKGCLVKSRAIVLYEKHNKTLVHAANRQGFDWKKAKPWLVDSVLSRRTFSGAVDQYAFACKRICQEVNRMDLWDERVFNSGIRDSFPFWLSMISFGAFWEIVFFVLTGSFGIATIFKRWIYGASPVSI